MIQARVIDGGKTGVLATLFGARDTSNDMSIISDIIGTPIEAVRDSLQISLSQLNEAYNGSETINMGRLILANHTAVFDQSAMTIIGMHNIDRVNNRMKEIIMSNPELMRLDGLGVIDGYANVDRDPDLHRWIDSGSLVLNSGQMQYTTFSGGDYDELYDELDKHIITETWHNIQDMLAEGIDPTSEDLSYFD